MFQSPYKPIAAKLDESSDKGKTQQLVFAATARNRSSGAGKCEIKGKPGTERKFIVSPSRY